MGKRFTDTEKFNDKWYRTLSLLHKVVWEYLLAECNHAGILEKFDIDLMSFKIGTTVTMDDLKCFGDRIIFITDEVLYIPKFIKFQYGNLNPQSKVHASVLKELEKWGINTLSIGLHNPIDSIKDKDKNKEKDKDKKDITCNLNFENCFKIYQENCKNLLPLCFERKSKAILDELNQFLQEIDYDFEYFLNLCKKANSLKTIVDKKIDFRSMVRNHIGITNGKYIQKPPANPEPRGMNYTPDEPILEKTKRIQETSSEMPQEFKDLKGQLERIVYDTGEKSA